MNSRVALCLSGLVGGAGGKDGKGEALDVQTPYERYREHVLDTNDVDVFMHSWSLDARADLIRFYHPVAARFEKQIQFSDKFREHITRSRWYSMREALWLKRAYEAQHGFRYRMVMVSRFDSLWFTDVVFSEYDPAYFWASHWNHNGPNKLGPYDRTNRNTGRGFLDLWFFSGSENMDRFGKLYDALPLEGVRWSSHLLAHAWVKRLKLPVRYAFWRGYDHEIYRRWRRPGWHVE